MALRNFRIGSLLGIPILVSPSWFVIFGLTTWFLATRFYPEALDASTSTHIVMALASAASFFVSIVLHELAHSIVARHFKIPVKSITLFLFGGVAQITREAARPMQELLMAAAGPLSSIALGAGFLGVWWGIGGQDDRPVDYVLIWLAIMNAILGVFNLLPAFPMDGGRVFRSLIWLVSGNHNLATGVAAWTGRGFAWTAMALGTLAVLGYDVWAATDAAGGLWLLFIGLFLENSARNSLVQNRLVVELARYRAADLMQPDPPVVAGGQTVGALARGVIEINPRVCYMVRDGDRLAGLLSGYQMRAVPEQHWDTVTAAEAMVPSAALRAAMRESLISDVLMEMEVEDLLHMPVVEDGRVVGIVARDRILGVLRQAGLLGSSRA